MDAAPVVGAFVGGMIGGMYAVQSLKVKFNKRVDDLDLIMKHAEQRLDKLQSELGKIQAEVDVMRAEIAKLPTKLKEAMKLKSNTKGK